MLSVLWVGGHPKHWFKKNIFLKIYIINEFMTGERNINRKKVNPLKAGRIKKRVRKLNQKKEAEKRVPLRMEDMTKKQRRE